MRNKKKLMTNLMWRTMSRKTTMRRTLNSYLETSPAKISTRKTTIKTKRAWKGRPKTTRWTATPPRTSSSNRTMSQWTSAW
jgi:hypothetical protein